MLLAGHSQRSIQRQLGMTWRTGKQLADAANPEALFSGQHCPELAALTRHVRSFGAVLTQSRGERLPDRLDAVRQDDLPSLYTFAAGLTLPWNSGVVEGHANRIKMLKRQMFGRAGFRPLRKRVLLSC
ncbi:hypothetical protein [Streptomyces erythrochromogenes]|uniref:hypothetical protein n=1 Tax=Streptomyces erythrochromogenes TaxID=285574 RepID=UPI003699C392